MSKESSKWLTVSSAKQINRAHGWNGKYRRLSERWFLRWDEESNSEDNTLWADDWKESMFIRKCEGMVNKIGLNNRD